MIPEILCKCPEHGDTVIESVVGAKSILLKCGCEFVQRRAGRFSPPRRQRSASEKAAILERFSDLRKTMGNEVAAREIGIPFMTLWRWKNAMKQGPEQLEPKKMGRPKKDKSESTKQPGKN